MTRVPSVGPQAIDSLNELSLLLGKFAAIQRKTLLPNGEPESDSHHSFSLALTALHLATTYAPELSIKKILLYSLVHDLTELVTGDESTLLATPEQLKQKAKRDRQALVETLRQFQAYPAIAKALEAYESMADQEALFVYWIDKTMTIFTHFYDNGTNLKALGIKNQPDITVWYERTLQKLAQAGKPHHSAVYVLKHAYQKMHDELLEPA